MVLLKDGSAVERGYSEYRRTAIAYPFQRLPAENAGQSRARSVPDGSGMPHMRQTAMRSICRANGISGHYNDYVQEALRQIVSATGHQQRLTREGMVMKNGMGPSEDALKQERLIVEVASGIKMLELGLPARLSDKKP